MEKDASRKGLLTIGEMAKLCDISVQTLRYYDGEGILIPQYKDEKTGYRYYAMENVARLYLIKHLRHLDISIDYIKGLGKSDNIKLLIAELNMKVKSYKNEIEQLQRKQIESEQLLALLSEGLEVPNEKDICEKIYKKRYIRKEM